MIMKIQNIFRILPALLAVSAAALFAACDNAEAGPIENRVYIYEATSSAASKVAVEEDGATLAMTIRMAIPLDEDVTVGIRVEPSVLAAYNETYSTSFEVLPAEYYNIETPEVVIKAGDVAAPQSVISVGSFTTGGKNYALPVAIDHIDGSVEQTATTSHFIFLLDKPLIVQTPILKGYGTDGTALRAGPLDTDGNAVDWGIQTNNWTLEGWVRMDGFSRNNQALFNTGSKDHEIYIRFGDATPTPYDYMQIKTLGSQVNTKNNKGSFLANIWTHFALTYDGTTCVIYMNGEVAASFDPPAPKGGIVRFDYMQMIGSGSTYFRNNCNLSQVRLWKVTLSQTQIQNNMFYELDASNPDMMAYWKMDEGEGTTFIDATGNKHDIKFISGQIFQGWTGMQRFDK